MNRAFLIVFLFLINSTLAADEGQWPPDELKSAPLSKKGIHLKASDLWNEKGEGLASGAINVDDCSAGFVSAEGLIVTNYHCAFDAVQQASTVEKNYLKDGFLAGNKGEEIPARAGIRVLILKKITDVTDRVIGTGSKAAAATSDAERYDAVERARKEIVAECEKQPNRRCNVPSFYDGLQFKLHEQLELKDVRVVYSPPRSIGEYGGEIDNWQWPRHTGDFTVLRAYVNQAGDSADYSEENVPYRPPHFFPISTKGVTKGDPVLILGYPGRTNRFLTASAVKDQLEWFQPLRTRIYRKWIEILEEAGKANADVALRTAPQIKTLANREKNARGQIAGLQRNQVLAKTLKQEQELEKWIGGSSAREKEYGKALQEVEDVLRRIRKMRDHDFLLRELSSVSNSLGSGLQAVRFAKEREKPDLERNAGYQDRDLERAIDKEKDRTKTLAPDAERRALSFLLDEFSRLPEDQRLKSLERFPELLANSEAWLKSADDQTSLKEEAVRVQNMKARLETLQASKDPYIQLALALDESIENKILRDKEYQGALLKARPAYLKALKEFRGGNIYPDANGTLRIGVAEVTGYSPQESVVMEPQTTLEGMVAKHTGEPPFDLPKKVLDAAATEKSQNVPLCLLTNGDTTGGSSGSSILNGEGKLVSVNFDRVWENIAGDFGWTSRYSRNISVDTRFLIWLLQKVEKADALVAELTAAQ